MLHYYDQETKCIYVTPDCVIEALHLIRDLGMDYDGYENDIAGLRYLIDEFVALAGTAIDFANAGRIFTDKEREESSYKQAREKFESDRV